MYKFIQIKIKNSRSYLWCENSEWWFLSGEERKATTMVGIQRGYTVLFLNLDNYYMMCSQLQWFLLYNSCTFLFCALRKDERPLSKKLCSCMKCHKRVNSGQCICIYHPASSKLLTVLPQNGRNCFSLCKSI
jgi:hypothetical protein